MAQLSRGISAIASREALPAFTSCKARWAVISLVNEAGGMGISPFFAYSKVPVAASKSTAAWDRISGASSEGSWADRGRKVKRIKRQTRI
jgi:hypothetical protein